MRGLRRSAAATGGTILLRSAVIGGSPPRGRTRMKTALGSLAAALLACIVWAQPAAAQGVPQGSYLRSCSDARMRGDTLVALCRGPGNYANWTWLNELRRCRGDIGNNGGWLTCNYAAGPPGPPPHDGRAERRRERCE